LIYAITIADLLDPADLAAGRTIAATGQVDGSGHIYNVGFVKEKAAVARAAGATLLLVPPGQDPGNTGITVVEVATLDDALAALRSP
jgi:PDZ domain-containing protein